ncbi:hypothetical protein D3C81_1958450 [compost metagenome]
MSANTVKINTTGNTTSKCLTDLPSKNAPKTPVTKTKINCWKILLRLAESKIAEVNSEELLQEKLGTGAKIPESAKKMVASPKITTTQSSVSANDLDDAI